MKRFRWAERAAVLLIAVWMIAGGVLHLAVPDAFYPIVPDWLPERLVVILSGVAELLIGVGVLFPRSRALAGLAFAALCAGLLPLHLWDFFRPDPIFAPWPVAVGRCLLQLGLIALGLWLWRRARRRTSSGAISG